MPSHTPTEIDDLLRSLGVSNRSEVPSTPDELPDNAVEDVIETAAKASSHGLASVLVKKPTARPGAPRKPAPIRSDSTLFQLGAGRAFTPLAPNSLEEAGLSNSEVSSLILKFLLSRSVEAGSRIAQQIGLKFPIIETMLRQMKVDRLVVYKNSIAGGDYLYELTELGRERGRTLAEHCTYHGTAPVSLKHYIASVKAQSLEGRRPPLGDIRKAFSDLDVGDKLLSSIGQAIHSGRGMFLYGAPGNGKTSMAERVTKSYGDRIWIPRTLVAGGEIIRLFDPNRHKLIGGNSSDSIDGRWVQIERPTIVAGGELQMENLEITYIRKSGIGEAPLQLKANCGTLLIDDFGRQRMRTDELLNRWIVPLEQRHDFLHLESGRTIQVPFDQLIIFSSNLEPRDLVDDAFLRRIPYKIEVRDPSEGEFRSLFSRMAKNMGFICDHEIVDYMVTEHYVKAQRPFRFCHPRDLIRQVENRCTLHDMPRVITREAIDQAIENYFSIM